MMIISKIKIVLISFCFVVNFAQAELKPMDIISKELDKNIAWLINSNPSKKSVIEKFGKPQLEEKNKIYYALNGYKYSLCMQFDKNLVTYINYKLPSKTQIAIKEFENIIKSKDFSLYPPEGHEKGRFLSTLLIKENLQLIFNNNSEKQLTRIIYDKK